MKQMLLLFVALVAGFLGTWTYKIKSPVNRPDEYEEGYDAEAGTWWNTSASKVSDDWTLDPTIPANYIPVPGEENLFMVVDNDGKIIEYRRRTKELDGSWTWETVNPDIPEGYEPVEGLENVYKVTDENGNVRYYKYIRNDDDTFAWEEVDENGNPIGLNEDATTIGSDHVHVTGNIYKRLNENGVVVGYDKRIDNGDGTFSWLSTDMPDLSSLDSGGGSSLADGFGSNTGSSLNAGSLDTSDMDRMAQAMADANASVGDDSYTTTYTIIPDTTNGSSGDAGVYNYSQQANADDPVAVNNPDGTHTETKVSRETKTVNGITTTYETLIKNTYNDDGELIKTVQEGPYEVDATQSYTPQTEVAKITGADPDKKENLAEESVRVTSKWSYDEEKANEVYALLNAYRTQNSLQALKLDDTAMTIAKLRAGDMASHGAASGELPTYGTLGTMLSEYGITATAEPGENQWKTQAMSASEINDRFQAVDDARKRRTSKNVTKYGIAIVNSSDGYMYICEVFL